MSRVAEGGGRVGAFGRAAVVATVAMGALLAGPRTAEAACGPTFCPSYTTCRIAPVEKPNPPFGELSKLFDTIAPGPSKYGSAGWAWSRDLNDGAGKPFGPVKTPARFPCSLLKAIGVHESVGWHQFCVPTGPECTGVSQTIIAFDCGYGLMQVTSGMRRGETSAYDPGRVASDPGYNVSVGAQILATKWFITPAVGDNRLDVIEDWYFGVWAYNGLAAKNNPNYGKYDADRRPYRDPGGGSGGDYPYQEIIWGYVRVPYGAKEGGGPAYKGFPLSYPNRAEICASCGNPRADISDPKPIHWSDCPSTAPPPPPPGPQLEIAATPSGVDRFTDGASKGIVDHMEGDEYTTDITVKNVGDAPAKSVDLGVTVREKWIEAVHYDIESDWGSPGTFKPNDASTRPDNPPHDRPGAALTFHINALSPGETKRVRIRMTAARYSIGETDSPDVRAWVKDVPGVYSKGTFDAKPTFTGAAQRFNGGDLRSRAPVDVYSRTRWSFKGDLLEGWTAAGAAEVVARKGAKALVVIAKGEKPMALSPETSFSAAAFPIARLRARTALGIPTRLYFATSEAPEFDERRSFPTEIPADGAVHEILFRVIANPAWRGTVTRLRVAPAPAGMGELAIDELRMMASADEPTGPPGSGSSDAGLEGLGDGGVGLDDAAGYSGGCSCKVAGRGRGATPTNDLEGRAGLLFAVLASLGLVRRRRVARH